MTDTDGRLLTVQVNTANIQDRDRSLPLLCVSGGRRRLIETVFADGGYAGKLVSWAK